MNSIASRSLAAALVMAVAAPVAAQTPPPPPMTPAASMAPAAPIAPAAPMAGMRHGGMGMMGGHMFPSLSEAGRAAMRDAMKSGGDRREEREGVRAARDRMLSLLEADRLDPAALKRAMDDERNAANASRERHQAAMLAAFGKLSAADRKAFVVDSRAMKNRMEQRMSQWRGRGMRGMHGDMAAPPPPPPGM